MLLSSHHEAALKTKVNKVRNFQYLAKFIFTMMLAGGANVAFAQEKQPVGICLNQFYKEIPPVVQNEKLKKDSYPLCFNGFNVLYSGVSKTPLWVAEYLNPDRLSQKIPREDSFHAEDRVAAKHRAELADYRGSGYDRGHMAPNADMPNKAAQYDSFSLANMVPQTPQNNQQVWRELEEATRALVTKQQQDVYVFTGADYSGKNPKKIGQGVLVPNATYKAIYAPKSGVIGAYYVSNDMKVEKPQVELMSICALEDKLQINLFPQLTAEQKRDSYRLPLKASEVKANQKVAYLQWDEKSKCAPEVDKSQLKQLQAQFKPDHDYVGVAVSAQTQQTTTGHNQLSTNTETENSGWLKILLDIIQFILQLLK